MRAAIYFRYSQGRFGDEQRLRRQCVEWCRARGYEVTRFIVGVIPSFIDRVDLRQLMTSAAQREIDVVVIPSPEQLSIYPGDILQILHRLEQYGVYVDCLNGPRFANSEFAEETRQVLQPAFIRVSTGPLGFGTRAPVSQRRTPIYSDPDTRPALVPVRR